MYQIDPRLLSAAMTQDFYSPWSAMMQGAEPPQYAPPPFVPVPVPVPMPPPGPAGTTTVDPLPSSDEALMQQLMKPYNKGWRHGK